MRQRCEQLEAAATRNLRVRFRTGVFDNPDRQPMSSWGAERVCTNDSNYLSLRAAQEGMVLMKLTPGKGLPLDAALIKKVALVGGNANDTMMQLCSYYSVPCGGYGARHGQPFAGIERALWTQRGLR